MKRVSSILLTLAMLLSLSVPAWAAESDSSVSTDVNSEAAKAWSGYDASALQMNMSPSHCSGYGDLTEGQFFIAKFSADDIRTAGIQEASEEYKLSFAAVDASEESVELEGYVGMYWVFVPQPNTSMTVWTGLHVQSSQTSSFNKFQVKTPETVNCRAMFDLSKDVYIGFAATSAVPSGTRVTISLINDATVSRSHTFEASSSAPEIDNTLTGISIKLDEAYGSYYTAYNDYLLFKDGFTDPNPNVTAEEGHDGRSMVLHAVRSPIGATDAISWSSNPVGIVEFQTSSDGLDCTVIAREVGNTTVTVSAGSFSASVPVRVVSTTYSVNSTSYNTLSDAIVAAGDSETISVKGSASIAGVYVADGATVTAVSDNAVQSTNSTATVTPKTLTIANGANQKTVKAYVVSNGSGENEVKAVVTNVAKDNTFTNETSSTSVESYVNVAKVLANAVAEKSIDVSSISSMTLRLDQTSDTASATLGGNDSGVKTALQSKLDDSSITVYDVKPIATVTTATTTGGTTTTQTYDYDASKEVTGSFKFKLHVSDNSTDVGKTANLTHYHDDNGTWTATPITGIVDSNGDVTVTLNQFSYISVDGLEYEVFGEVYNYAGLFGNTYEMTIRFKYGNVVAANMSGYTVQLWLENGDGAGKDRLLSSSSASEYQASNVTTYKMGGVFTSGGNTFRNFTVKLFAQYLDSKIIVKLVRNSDSAVLPIATFGYRTIRTSTVATDGWGYSLKEFINFRADYFNDASCGNNTAAATAYSNLSSAISSISSATKAASAYAN